MRFAFRISHAGIRRRGQRLLEDDMRIAAVGVGAVGGYFGGHLVHAGEDVTFVEGAGRLRSKRRRPKKLS